MQMIFFSPPGNKKETTIFSKDQLKSWYSNIEIGDLAQIYPLNPDDQSVLFDVEEVFAVNENGNFITQRMQIQNPGFFLTNYSTGGFYHEKLG